MVAPREIQQTQKLLTTGWALATVDFKHTGLIPINYLKREEMPTALLTPNTGVIDAAYKLPTDSIIGDVDSINTIPYDVNEPIGPNEIVPLVNGAYAKDATNCLKEEES